MDMRAREIAAEHIRAMNPSLWDGEGERPPDFNCGIAVYPLDEYTALNISFELEKDGWTHCCQLRNRETGELLNVLHGYGVDSPQNLTDTIEDIASDHLKGGR